MTMSSKKSCDFPLALSFQSCDYWGSPSRLGHRVRPVHPRGGLASGICRRPRQSPPRGPHRGFGHELADADILACGGLFDLVAFLGGEGHEDGLVNATLGAPRAGAASGGLGNLAFSHRWA